MKTMANCSPIEFLSQGYKIIDKVSKLLKETRVLDIRKKTPSFSPEDTEEEKKAKIDAQSKKNIMEMLQVLMEENPKETAEVLALLCFIAPEELENHKGIEFIQPAIEILTSSEVLGFFQSVGLTQ